MNDEKCPYCGSDEFYLQDNLIYWCTECDGMFFELKERATDE